jgi:hypothetical protein
MSLKTDLNVHVSIVIAIKDSNQINTQLSPLICFVIHSKIKNHSRKIHIQRAQYWSQKNSVLR